MGLKRILLMATVLLSVAACESLPVQDAAPRQKLDPALLFDAKPRYESVGAAGNTSPYSVMGKTYSILPSANGYRQEGIASWYGTKFHGKLTSNGESYDLYDMSAAHKTLPIPCYVRVTNLDNNLTAVVRVNDRGPFHQDRIIDLSYAAATKLGYVDRGTANVKVEVIDFTPPASEKRFYLQAGAFSDRLSAEKKQQQLQQLDLANVVIMSGTDRLQRVRFGPLYWHELAQLKTELTQRNIATSVIE